MNSAHPIKDEASAPGMGAQIVAAGAFPSKQATVTAEVLARLLAGEKLTSLDGVYAASTTRLAAVVHYLQSDYGWTIKATNKAAGCRDGRVSVVSEYAMPPAVIACAKAAGAADWCAEVRKVRTALRAQAARALHYAQRVNAARAAGHVRAAQGGLFDNEGAPA